MDAIVAAVCSHDLISKMFRAPLHPLIRRKALALDCIDYQPHLFRHCSHEVRGDWDVALAAVKRDGGLLQYASDSLKQNRDLAIIALAHGGTLQDVASELQDDKALVLLAVTKTPAT